MARVRCAIYTRKSSEDGLEQDFNSLDAQREACAAFIASQKAEGWVLLPEHYDDGGLSGGTLERPALMRLMRDLEAGKLDQIVADYGTKYQAVRNDPMFQTMGAGTFFKLLGDVEKCIGKASPQAQLDANQLTDLQKVAIHGYTCTDTCYALNRMLREAGGDRSGLSPYGQAHIQHIEDGLNALPRPNPNDYDSFNDNGNNRVMVYRGAKHLPHRACGECGQYGARADRRQVL